jgi:cytidylate kinase
MKTASHADQCLSFIRCDLSSKAGPGPGSGVVPSLTLSRQDGCGAAAVARELEVLLEAAGGPSPGPWTVIDKELVNRVVKDHGLPAQVARFMPEGHVSVIESMVEEVLGMHPSTRTLLKLTNDSIRRLAKEGRVILVGRGANLVTRDMESVFHVRMVAPPEWRCRRVMERDGLDHAAAMKRMKDTDQNRKSYVKDHFNADIDDPNQYDMVLNTARLSTRTAAHLIVQAMCHWVDLRK